MVGPTTTGSILVLYGHGAVLNETFDFRRAQDREINLYAWTGEGIPLWNTQAELAAQSAMNGEIRNSYATVNSSRIGGALIRDYGLWPLSPVDPHPAIPGGFHNTVIAGLNATVYHNAPTLAASNRMWLLLNAGAAGVRLSTILADANFNARPLDVLWCACKVHV